MSKSRRRLYLRKHRDRRGGKKEIERAGETIFSGGGEKNM